MPPDTEPMGRWPVGQRLRHLDTSTWEVTERRPDGYVIRCTVRGLLGFEELGQECEADTAYLHSDVWVPAPEAVSEVSS